jgi:hypothetical protein
MASILMTGDELHRKENKLIGGSVVFYSGAALHIDLIH